ncbi:Vacuolar amino acid transporter 3 [Durusdinium trenchii]|uniref:Vacuolar amino acid transporter 3 n=1 Tax=Durusdinium trenchii TaxID=1381693 RepID=A0ABP0L1K0_9DINO
MRRRLSSGAGRRPDDAQDDAAAGGSEEEQEVVAADLEAGEDALYDAAVEAAIEDDAYERIIVNTPDVVRDIMKAAVVERYVTQDRVGDGDDEGSFAATAGAAGDDLAGDLDRQDESESTLLQRSASHPDLNDVMYPEVGHASEINVPGGFRREYIVNELEAEMGHEVDDDEIPEVVRTSFLESLLASNSATLYAWVEDFLESDDEDEGDDDSADDSDDQDLENPLLAVDGASLGSRGRRQMVFSSYGRRSIVRRNSDYQNDSSLKASNTRTMFTLFKCFVATGVLFLPHGFKTAGLVAGAATITVVGMISLAGMFLLIRTRAHVEQGFQQATPTTPLLSTAAAAAVSSVLFPRRPVVVNTYSQLGGQILGRPGRRIVELSILLSQLGFCCVYISFSGNSLYQAFGGEESPHASPEAAPSRVGIPLWGFMAATVPVIIPLTLIRHLKHFAIPNLVANIFVALSLAYILVQATVTVAESGDMTDWSCDGTPHTACFFINPSEFALFLGSSVYVFEGITMVIPIQNSMQDRQQLPDMLTKVLGTVTVLFCLFGSLNFYAYGQDTAPIILNNLPQAGKVAVTCMFVIVAVFMFPLMAFPAAQIIEKRLFKKMRRSGKKWQKNFIRTCIVLFCFAVSFLAGEKVDKLVAVIGGMFCVPLALVYPPLFFLRSGCAQDLATEVVPAAALCTVGVFAAVLSSATAISQFNT